MGDLICTLSSPITEEEWDMLEDVDFEHTEKIYFHTKHGKDVEFVKALQWTSCSEKLPSSCAVVLVQTKDSIIVTAYYKDGKWYSYPQWGEYTSDGWKQKDLTIGSVVARTIPTGRKRIDGGANRCILDQQQYLVRTIKQQKLIMEKQNLALCQEESYGIYQPSGCMEMKSIMIRITGSR